VKKYSSPLEMSLYHDNISVDVYKNLIESVHDNLDTFYDYMKLRKKVAPTIPQNILIGTRLY
jgi:oligoendopeptidase F